MSLIEQAAKRLEELRRAGVETAGAVDGPFARAPLPSPTSAADSSRLPDLDFERSFPAATGRPDEPPPRSALVEIDLALLARRGFAVPGAQRSRIVDEFRAIKRPLLANVRGESAAPVKHANCIMISSALAGEGKTFTTLNLAFSIAAEVDSHVLLVDADIVKPSVLPRLGLPPDRPGLLDKLKNPDLPLSDLILRTNVDKLAILPAGIRDPHANERLSSGAMRAIVHELATRYPDRVLIFDSPPLLLAPETSALATMMGQIVVVVEAQKTARKAVVDALQHLSNCPVVMMLLNKATGSAGKGYGYGYGHAA